MAKTYFIQTFGCQMNERDSETLAGMLAGQGFLPAEEYGEADVIVMNTCSVREHADERFFGTLGQLKKIKERRPEVTVCICGCMMQQEHIIRRLQEKFPWIDLIFGTHNLHRFPRLLAQVEEKRERMKDRKTPDLRSRAAMEGQVMEVWDEEGEMVEHLPARRKYRHKAFVNIMYGCNNFCTYCIVPYTRGRERSRSPEAVLEEVRKLAADETREVTLLGQNVNSYRGESSCTFAELVGRIAEVDGIDRIRFMTSHPKDLSGELIDAYRDLPKLCGHIHLPVQSGSDRILERMNRKYDRAQYLSLVEKLRTARPDIAITTDIIVGFPGETEEDFVATLDLCRQVGFDSAFTFLYSIRKGTPAATFDDQIPDDVKHQRFDRLVEVINAGAMEKNKALVGKTLPVLVDEAGSGRTDGFKLVNFQGGEEQVGRIVPVRITGATTFSLTGEGETVPGLSNV